MGNDERTDWESDIKSSSKITVNNSREFMWHLFSLQIHLPPIYVT